MTFERSATSMSRRSIARITAGPPTWTRITLSLSTTHRSGGLDWPRVTWRSMRSATCRSMSSALAALGAARRAARA